MARQAPAEGKMRQNGPRNSLSRHQHGPFPPVLHPPAVCTRAWHCLGKGCPLENARGFLTKRRPGPRNGQGRGQGKDRGQGQPPRPQNKDKTAAMAACQQLRLPQLVMCSSSPKVINCFLFGVGTATASFWSTVASLLPCGRRLSHTASPCCSTLH